MALTTKNTDNIAATTTTTTTATATTTTTSNNNNNVNINKGRTPAATGNQRIEARFLAGPWSENTHDGDDAYDDAITKAEHAARWSSGIAAAAAAAATTTMTTTATATSGRQAPDKAAARRARRRHRANKAALLGVFDLGAGPGLVL